MYFILTILTMTGSLGYGSTGNCFGGYRDDNSGHITSPGYPGNYPINVEYTWIIRTGHINATVLFTITDMDIKEWSPCDDYLEIQEIDPHYFSVFRRCGKLQNEKVEARGKEIMVTFVSDRSLTAKGFNLSYTVSSPLPPTTTKRVILSTKQTPSLTDNKTIQTTTTTSSTTTTTSITTKTTPSITTTPTTTTTRRTKTSTTTKQAVTIKPKLSVPRTASQLTTAANQSMVTQVSNHAMINSSTTVSSEGKSVISSEFTVDQIVRLMIGICVIGLIIAITAVFVTRRLKARFSDKKSLDSKRHPTDHDASIHYQAIPVEHFSAGEFREADEAVYVDRPENVYDSTFASRTHAIQDNINVYHTCQDLYDTTLSKRQNAIDDLNAYGIDP